MNYTSARMGRVFVLKFDHHDILRDELERFVRKQKIKTGVLVFLGALKDGVLVTGPRRAVIPPIANRTPFKDAWEVYGVGTIFPGPGGPAIHIHGGMGKNKRALTGCVRERSRVFLVVEAVVFELTGVKASKVFDAKTGLTLLNILK